MTRDELRNAIGSACDHMRRGGLTTVDYMEQFSWLLFRKSFEETGKGDAAGDRGDDGGGAGGGVSGGVVNQCPK